MAAGIVTGTRQRDMQGGKMAFVTLDDGSGRVEVTLRGDLIESSAEIIQKEEVLIVEGDISPDDFNGGFKIKARELYDLDSARSRFARRLIIRCKPMTLEESLGDCIGILEDYKSGPVPVIFDYSGVAASARIRAGRRWGITPKRDLIDRLSGLLGEEDVELVY